MLYSTLIDDLQDNAGSYRSYDTISIVFHWMTAVLLVAMFWTAHAHEAAQDGTVADRMLLVHRSMGIIVWIVTVARLGWKSLFGTAPALPATMMPAQRAIARAMQAALYALLFFMPATGLFQSILRGKAFPLLLGEFPAIVARNRDAMDLFRKVHEAGATILLVLIGLHALAGIYHGIARRDGVLGSMLPVFRSKRR